MRVVLLQAGNRLPSASLIDFIERVRTPTVEVSLACWAAPTEELVRICSEVVVLGPLKRMPSASPEPAAGDGPRPAPSADAADLTVRPRGVSPERLRVAVRWRLRRVQRGLRRRLSRPRALMRRRVGRIMHLLGRDGAKARRRFLNNPAVAGLLASADVVIALDSLSVRTAWEVARARPGVTAVIGLAAGERAVRRGSQAEAG